MPEESAESAPGIGMLTERPFSRPHFRERVAPTGAPGAELGVQARHRWSADVARRALGGATGREVKTDEGFENALGNLTSDRLRNFARAHYLLTDAELRTPEGRRTLLEEARRLRELTEEEGFVIGSADYKFAQALGRSMGRKVEQLRTAEVAPAAGPEPPAVEAPRPARARAERGVDRLRREVEELRARVGGYEGGGAGRAGGPERVEPPREGGMFSLRWIRLHGLPDRLPPVPALGIHQEFSSSVVLSGIYESGFSQFLSRQTEAIIGSSEEEGFQAAVSSGLFPLMALDRAMKSSRIDSVSETVRASGPFPEGVSRWLKIDQETRRCLALLFRLQGYRVESEPGVNDTIVLQKIPEGERRKYDLPFDQPRHRLAGTQHAFSEVVGRDSDGEITDRKGITSAEIEKYLEAIRRAVVVSPDVSTDRGVARLAYTIFRYFAFPQENGKILELYEQRYDAKTGQGDFEREDINPFLNKIRDPGTGKYLRDVLTEGKSVTGEVIGGIPALAEALERIRQEQIARDWADFQRLLDLKDAVNAYREGRGPEAGRLSYRERYQAILKLMDKEMGILDVKRKLTDATVQRLVDPLKISTQYERGYVEPSRRERSELKGILSAPVRQVEREGQAVRNLFKRVGGWLKKS